MEKMPLEFRGLTHVILSCLNPLQDNPSTVTLSTVKLNTYTDATIQRLEQEGYIANKTITKKGKLLRRQLSLLGPHTTIHKEDTLCVLLNTLIEGLLPHELVTSFNYCIDTKLVHCITSPSTKPICRITDLGIRWIKEHKNIMFLTTYGVLLLHTDAFCSLLTIEELPSFLSSNQEVIRDAAKERLNKLEKGETNASS